MNKVVCSLSLTLTLFHMMIMAYFYDFLESGNFMCPSSLGVYCDYMKSHFLLHLYF